MINPEELMLGNYIKFNGKETIVTINTFQVLANSCKRKLFEPIEISEKELVEFGFELKDPINRGYLIPTRESLKEYLYCSKNGVIASYSELLEKPRDFVYKQIKFIHSLQNFYFNLTGGKQLTK